MEMVDDDPQHMIGLGEGEILVGKYRVERLLGVGGMGVVVAARHLQLDTSVAIKVLLPSMLANPEAIARFAREARAAIELRSGHVARIFDVGTLPTGAPYIVMELLEGADLRKILDERGPLAVEDAVDFVVQACEAIAEAHGLGIVHRDLKPANLFCVQRPDGGRTIKVLDFGISKVSGPMWAAPAEPLTVAAAVMGTPSYMSPEQLEAPDTVDARTDVWALGVILYELLTAKAPFDGSTLPQVSVRIAIRPPPPLRELRPNIPAGLATAIERCLEKDRDQRYPGVVDLATALSPFGSRRARISVNHITESVATPQPGRRRRLERRALPVLLLVGAAIFLAVRAPRWLDAHPDGSRSASRGPVMVRPPTVAEAIQIAPAPPQQTVMANAGLVAPGLDFLPVTVDRTRATPPARAVRGAVSPPAVARRGTVRGSARSESMKIAAAASAPSMIANPNRIAAAACDPPFEIDDQGRKHFKAECWSRSTSVAASVVRAGGDASCEPSYSLDDQGRKHFKPECFAGSTR